MGNDYHEKDYDDEVYEDDYYEKHYDEEELEDDDVIEDDRPHLDAGDEEEDEEEEDDLVEEEEIGDLDWKDPGEKKVTVSYACDECDYRWDDIVIRKKDEIEEEEADVICPMCGSMNITLI